MKSVINRSRGRVKAEAFLMFLLAALLCVFSIPAQGQSRIAEIEKQQAEKYQKLHPYVPNKAERIITEIQGLGLLSAPRGLYPFIGSAYPGGGFAGGPGFRRLYGDNGIFDIHGAWSFANYRMIDTSLKLPDLAKGEIGSLINAHYVYAGKVNFYGVGNDTSESDKTDFLWNPLSVELTETYRPVKWFSVGGSIAYLDAVTGPGEAGNIPSIDTEFTPETAPGLGQDPNYVVGSVFASFDTRQSPGYTTSGTLLSAEYFDYNDYEDLGLSFTRLDVDARQYFPILRANWVIAVRALFSFTGASGGNQVPYFLMPKLGGGSDLRGFGNNRFMDTNRMLFNVEYRWLPSKFLDMVLFYDTGKVASNSADLDFSDLHWDWGIGARFHTPTFVALRIDFAHSKEGNHLIISGGTYF